ncbi:hypothetical protein ABBQ38_010687 [Trebouxia sp. C0009 RCD-2024]
MQLDFAASIRPRSLLAGRACPSKLITGTESGEPPLRTMLRLTEVKRSASLRFLKQVTLRPNSSPWSAASQRQTS